MTSESGAEDPHLARFREIVAGLETDDVHAALEQLTGPATFAARRANRADAEAAQILRREREHYVADGRADAFTDDIRRIREEHRHRPALQDEFTRAGLP